MSDDFDVYDYLDQRDEADIQRADRINKIQAAIREHVSGACDCPDCAEALYVSLVQAGIIFE